MSFPTIMYVYYKQSEMDIHMSEQIEDVKYVISQSGPRIWLNKKKQIKWISTILSFNFIAFCLRVYFLNILLLIPLTTNF